MALATRWAATIALVAILTACEEPDGWKPGGSCGAGTFPLDGATDVAETVVLETDADQGVEIGLELRDASGGLVSGYSSTISWPVPFFGYVHILQFHPAAPLQFSGRYDGAVLWGREVACRFSFTVRAQGSGSWTATTTVDAPAGRSGHSAVWTGSEMIVWGGRSDIFGGAPLGDGARYDPVLDQWRALATQDAPSPRADHVAVWTGSEMVVWGGDYDNGGGRYAPALDQWTPLAPGGPVAASSYATWFGAWTGSDVLVWTPEGGGLYSPAANAWQAVRAEGQPAFSGDYAAAWTGTEMLIWSPGGSGRYTPSNDSWRPMSNAGAPQALWGFGSVWTGREMIVWGGASSIDVYLADGAAYDPALDRWRPVSGAGVPLAREYFPLVWTGRAVLAWGGYGSEKLGWGEDASVLDGGGFWDPSGGTWQTMAWPARPTRRGGHTAVWTGDEMIVFGGQDPDRDLSSVRTGGRYRP